MKNKMLLLLPILLFSPSCAVAPFNSGSPVSPGMIGSISVPGEGFETADLTSGIRNLDKGESSVWSLLGIISGGDSSIMSAARAGSINIIHHIDYEVFNFLGLYATNTTVVYGEK